MDIDKSRGRWFDGASELDDLAYKIYVDEWSQFFGDKVTNDVYTSQKIIIQEYKLLDCYSEYYIKAIAFLRKNKIKKNKK